MENTQNTPDIAKGEPFVFRLERSKYKDNLYVCVPGNVCDNPSCSCQDLGMAIYNYPGEGEPLSSPPVYTFVIDLASRSIQTGYQSNPESLDFAGSFLDHSATDHWDLYNQAFIYLKEEAIRQKKVLKGTSESVAGQIIDLSQGKTGRNDPCPCGSGKKYKNCCG
ncbi:MULTISPECIES: SEC-C metal-binding domain-containing protein [unclassified Oceanispirochaeta]|uniref:SEC-C metal-binding domain-containing protein n=1 Tax=unclassified Oceanispirochaeta TaxID=2635722 RepID=UPI001E352F72|nr:MULTISPECIES: SEC-C metal-binding domain-containing protein [unclassified Oceanispirochaeta]